MLIAFSSYYYLNLDPENFLEYLVPKADEENNNEEDENHSDQDGRRPGERELEGSLMWSSASEHKCPEKLKLDGESETDPLQEPKPIRILKRKGDALLSVRDDATNPDQPKAKLSNDCRNHRDGFESAAEATSAFQEVQLQKNDLSETDDENNSSGAPNKPRNPKHEKENVGNEDYKSLSEKAEHGIEKLVEYYATQQKVDDVEDEKTVIASSNMDVRVVVTNFVEEMEDQMVVGGKIGEQQQQDKLSVEGVSQEELKFIKELVAQLDREEKEDREDQLTQQLEQEDTVAQMDLDPKLEDSSRDILVSTSKKVFISGSKKPATEKCTRCKDRFTADSFRRHQTLPHDFECNVMGCDCVCVDLLTLKKHKKEVHFIGCLQQDIQYRCETCEEVMAPGPQFAKHIETAHCFACNHCDLKYVEEGKLRKHEWVHHRGKEKRRSNDLPLEK